MELCFCCEALCGWLLLLLLGIVAGEVETRTAAAEEDAAEAAASRLEMASGNSSTMAVGDGGEALERRQSSR